MRLNGNVAIVTGAATGIGYAIATRFAQEGAALIIDYVGSSGPAIEAAAVITHSGGKCVAIGADARADAYE